MKTKTAKENLTLEWSYLYRCDVCLPGFHSWLVCEIPIRWRKGGELLNEKNKVLTVYSLPWRRYVQSFKPIRCTGVVVEPANGFRIPNWFHRWFSLVREGWWAAQVWESGARWWAKKLISLVLTLVVVGSSSVVVVVLIVLTILHITNILHLVTKQHPKHSIYT